METRVQVVGGPLPAPGYEVGTVTFEGREFSSGGAAMSADGQHLIAYVVKRGPENVLTTWEGARLGTWRIVSTWKTRPPGAMYPIRVAAIRAVLDDGRVYAGRVAIDTGQLFRGRLMKGGK